MKKYFPTLTAMTLLGGSLSLTAADRIGYIMEEDTEGNALSATPIYLEGTLGVGTDSGTAQATVGVPDGGAIYSMFGYRLPEDPLYGTPKAIGQVAVAAYLPEATVSITSQDPNPVLQTRADIKFTVDMTFSGLKTDDDLTDAGDPYPDYAKTLYVHREYVDYNVPEEERVAETDEFFESPGNGPMTKEAITALSMVDNPDYDPAVDAAGDAVIAHSQRGQETFYVRAALGGDALLATPLAGATKSILVWPLAQAEITGLSDGDTVGSSIPAITVDVDDAYTTSKTYVVIYKGSDKRDSIDLENDADIVFSEYQEFYQVPEPQDITFTLTDLGEQAGADNKYEDGEYVLAVYSVTPFNGGSPEYVTHIGYTLDRTVSVNENGGTAE